jgi:pimeloyl-ACP methyl ester carboxylesterase
VERFSSFDGVEIAYESWGAGPPVLLLHGFASSHRGGWVASGVVDALVDAGRQPIAWDARGHGRSDKPHDPTAYDDDAMVRDAVELLDVLGVDGVDLVGYSMGAMAAVRIAARESRVRSVVLGGVGGDCTPPRKPGRLAEAMLAEDRASISHPVARAFRRFADLTKADRHALAAIDRSSSLRSAVDFEAVRMPALVVVGDKDTLVREPSDLVARLPDARLVVLPGDHLSVVSHAGFAPTIAAFLAKMSPTG